MGYDKLEKIINESFEIKENVGPKSDKRLVKAINETKVLVSFMYPFRSNRKYWVYKDTKEE